MQTTSGIDVRHRICSNRKNKATTGRQVWMLRVEGISEPMTNGEPRGNQDREDEDGDGGANGNGNGAWGVCMG